jgi:hypothetical protein
LYFCLKIEIYVVLFTLFSTDTFILQYKDRNGKLLNKPVKKQIMTLEVC